MAKLDDTPEREKETPWGTWEELLLACAVNRYGTKSWDSVAIEIQKRSSASTLHPFLTPHHCKKKYHDLRRRYATKENPNNKVSEPDGSDVDDVKTDTIPWLDELRKLRVTELKHELERYDLSIVSLQSKVKKLKEEREQSLRDSEKGGAKSDLEKSVEREREEEENTKGDGEPEKTSPKLGAGKSVSGEESDPENQSVNESNSTDPKPDNIETGREEVKTEPDPVQTGEEKPEGQTKPVREDSYNGSSDSIAKEPVRESVKVEPEGGESDSPELLESVAESKGGNEGAKESSDVQSCASLSRQKGRDKVGPGACSSGEEPENEDQSPTIKHASVKSQPFIDFLEIIRSHKLDSIFERRLESQETPRYRSLIRQHMDLKTIRTRIDEGWYSGCKSKFFRDLLLLINNAMVFFGKKSSESAFAIELQQLVSKELAQRNPKSDLSADERTSLPPVPVPLPSKPDPESSDFLLLKPKIAGPMIVCRKRSSIVAKASASSSGVDRKKEQAISLVEEKPMLDWKQPEESSVKAEENRITKKKSRERFASGSKSLKKNGKNRANTTLNKNSETISSQNQGKGGSSSEHSEPKGEKKKNTTIAGVVKRSATNLLNGTKRSSSSNNGPLLDKLKSSTVTSENDVGGEQKKSGNGKGDGRKDQVSRRSSGGRQAKEQASPGKRNVGRPPKRAAAPSPSIQPAVTGKRSRESGETEAAAASRQPKKRSRK